MKIKYFTILMILFNIIFISCNKGGTEPEPNLLELLLIPTHVSVAGGFDGSIDLTVTGGSESYQYQWSNGEITEDINGLPAGTYSVTVTDTNAETVTDSTTITQPGDTDTVTDIDGNVYQTVRIGDQWWMAENLKVVHNPQGNPITCYNPDNNASNVEVYGRLYSWYIAMDGSTTEGSRGIAPEGWHIPTLAEWNTLVNYLGGVNVAAAALKESGTEHWTSNPGATNSSGFTALPAGGYYQSSYDGFGFAAHFWVSTGNGDRAYLPSIMDNNVYTLFDNKNITASIRCIRD